MLLNYKIQHSPETGPAADCRRGSLYFKECKSPTAYIFTIFDLGSGQHVVSASSNRTEMTLSYPAEGLIDGRILGGVANNLIVHGARSPWPLPSADLLEAYSVNNETAPFTYIPATEQSLVIPLQLTVPRVMNRLDYDPDVSVSLLFDPDAGNPLLPSASPLQEDIPKEVQIGVVIAVVVAAVAAAAISVALFAKVIFPFLEKRKQALRARNVEEVDTEIDSQSVWRRSTMPTTYG
jgi:hypothetical protein